MQPIDWLTIGLVIFAGAQVWTQDREFRERRLQRDREKNQRIDQARTHLTIEWYRMRSISQQWTKVDLAKSIQVGQFDPEEILPPDRRSLVSDIGRLGETPTLLVMESFDNADDAAKIAKRIVAMVGRFTEATRQGVLPDSAENLETYQSTIEDLVTSIRLLALEATNCLEDAVANSPTGSGAALADVKPNAVSQSAQKLALTFAEEKTKGAQPPRKLPTGE
jgi:hypothetical protein